MGQPLSSQCKLSSNDEKCWYGTLRKHFIFHSIKEMSMGDEKDRARTESERWYV